MLPQLITEITVADSITSVAIKPIGAGSIKEKTLMLLQHRHHWRSSVLMNRGIFCQATTSRHDIVWYELKGTVHFYIIHYAREKTVSWLWCKHQKHLCLLQCLFPQPEHYMLIQGWKDIFFYCRLWKPQNTLYSSVFFSKYPQHFLIKPCGEFPFEKSP